MSKSSSTTRTSAGMLIASLVPYHAEHLDDGCMLHVIARRMMGRTCMPHARVANRHVNDVERSQTYARRARCCGQPRVYSTSLLPLVAVSGTECVDALLYAGFERRCVADDATTLSREGRDVT